MNNSLMTSGTSEQRAALRSRLMELARREGLKRQALAAQKTVGSEIKEVKSLVLDPTHKFYCLIHRRCKYKVFWGGRGSGKSWAVAEALIRIAAVRKVRVLCIREFQNSIKDSSYKILVDTIGRLGLEEFFHVTAEGIRSRAGAEFIFKGFHGPNASKNQTIKSTEGIDICWVEEAQTTTKGSWRALGPTLRKHGCECWVTYNMINVDDPTHERFVQYNEDGTWVPKRPNSIVYQINYDENPFFPGSPMEEEMLADKEESEHLYEHIWLGMPLVIDDSIILSGKYKVEDFPEELEAQAERVHLGADFGYSQDPSTLIKSFVIEKDIGRTHLDGSPKPWRTLYITAEAYRTGVENNQYDDFYSEVPDSKKWKIWADSAMPGLISHIRNEWGYRIEGAEKWAGCVEDGIKFLRGFDEIIISKTRCPKTAYEARMWRWKVDKKTDEILPIPVGKFNHAWDAVRYSFNGYIDRSGDVGIWARYGRRGAQVQQ